MRNVSLAAPAVRPAPPSYPLGHSDAELQRLEQARFLRDLTEDFLLRAGLREGMRVLDLGSGVGDVAFLAAEIVGPEGSVCGIDRSPEAVDLARRRAAATGHSNVTFVTDELEAVAYEAPYDAVIGRLILMYLPRPAAVMRRLADHLKPGGIMAFQEMLVPLVRSMPEGPLFRRCTGWVTETLQAAGADIAMGGKLHTNFVEAGFPDPEMIVLGRAEAGPNSAVYDFLAGALRSLLPVAEKMGVTTAEEVGIDTLAARLRDEAVRQRACILPPPFVGAWARIGARQ
jgi:ubiquinone/menaquinone biosynthesis C-methylase UbiE